MDSGLLDNLSLDDLMVLRRASDPSMQKVLAPYDHQKWAEEMVKENKANAFGLLGLIPAYQIAKLLGLGSDDPTTSKPSMAQGLGAIRGINRAVSRW